MSTDRDPNQLAVRIADGWRSVPADRVHAVLPAPAVVPLPGAPGWLRGLAWGDDTPVGVIDLAAFAGAGVTPIQLLVRLRDTGLAVAATAVRGAAPLDAPLEALDVDQIIERATTALRGDG